MKEAKSLSNLFVFSKCTLIVRRDLPSTNPVLPGSVPKSCNKIAAASEFTTEIGRTTKGWGGRFNINMALSIQPF